MRAVESQEITDTELSKIVYSSSRDRHQVYHSLMHFINVDSLRGCFNVLDGKKAVGADKTTKADYGNNLEANLENLIARMKRMAYRPQAVREVLIPKAGKAGATRPLGISNFEDKLVQKRMQAILESIYDPIFVEWSYGFRKGRSCHNAIKALSEHLYKNEVEVVLDVDLSNFFGTIDHQVLKELLSMKIKDTKFLRYISRMFKAGVLSGGELVINDEGVPQGSCCSPILANVMAHYVIDDWLEETVKPLLEGPLEAFRYADDMVLCFRFEDDALKVRKVLGKRLAKYKLALNKEKTKMVPFSKRKSRQGIKQGAFDFLGFTFYLGKSKGGYTIPKLKTNGKRFRSKLKKVNEWARANRNKGKLRMIWRTFCAKLRGHIQYYGVSHNSKAVANFVAQARRIIFKWLNRRSQRKSFTWDKFALFTQSNPLPVVKVVHKLF